MRKHWDKIIDAQEFMMWCFCVSVEEKKKQAIHQVVSNLKIKHSCVFSMLCFSPWSCKGGISRNTWLHSCHNASKCGAVLLWCGWELTSHSFKRNDLWFKNKNRHNRRGHTWCHLNSTSGWEQERYRVTELGVTATGLGQVASFCPSVLLEMNVTPGSQCICEDEWW